METVIKKTVTVEMDGKKYALQDEITIGSLLAQIGLSEDTPVQMKITKEGFLLIPQIQIDNR